MRFFLLSIILLVITGCSTTYQNQNVQGKIFPAISGQSLAKETVNIPNDFDQELTLLLVGYKQDAQFDIDRWLIGLDMIQTQLPVYEVPTIQGMFPRMFSTMIDNGMRAGIPKSLWQGVVSVYKDGDKVQAFTGNVNPNNARVILLNKAGEIVYFYDQGFSVEALNAVNVF
ncbi:hypothetical protein [Thalassotalea sp. PLHSN55]|uniref:hypothetical protein n=1 Tax=Thalassotalea sp. PLHSN55 TaxID=3435888 RepID=UPI003F842E9C